MSVEALSVFEGQGVCCSALSFQQPVCIISGRLKFGPCLSLEEIVYDLSVEGLSAPRVVFAVHRGHRGTVCPLAAFQNRVPAPFRSGTGLRSPIISSPIIILLFSTSSVLRLTVA